MRIAIVGSGGVGGYFGARLAMAGHDVHFIARGAHLQALQRQGLQIHSILGDCHLKALSATHDPTQIGVVDVVMLTCKLWDLEQAAAQCQSMLGERTVVIPFQNGVEAQDMVCRHLPAHSVAAGVAFIAAAIDAPGVIRHTGDFAKLRFGWSDQPAEPRLQAFESACRDAGVDGQQSSDIQRALWEKYVFLVTLSAWTAVTRSSIGTIRHDPAIRPCLIATLTEVVELARARGVALSEEVVAKQLAVIDSMPSEMKSSMLHDLERGHRLEAPWLSGGVTRLGVESAISTPVNTTLYAALKPFVMGWMVDQPLAQCSR
ncbi:2-dehydropantoate 2-reductase [Chitinivorax tropicus]|uniref:2-dehydropantoate 2-reductase n=1 Tax=Chitinivorax tropicus TaxID=714531 RepID=A0A840MUU4_9PROT|nr:2-dehydropantoate 2-reductase [Chitinivorax tropicus]MBB5020093.1 2-dehydropantoate 2-reductase [Chitinivorax tropicus]